MKTNFKNIDELGRREFIAHAAKACFGVGLMPMAGAYIHNNVQALEAGTRLASARHVIYLNMSGAMSHLDTFGTKPDCPDIQGPTKSIATTADGILLSEYLPKTAQLMHHASIIKTMVTSQGAHEQASYLMHTSYLKRGTIVHPTFGSWVSKLSGSINETIPSNIKIGGGGLGDDFRYFVQGVKVFVAVISWRYFLLLGYLIWLMGLLDLILSFTSHFRFYKMKITRHYCACNPTLNYIY